MADEAQKKRRASGAKSSTPEDPEDDLLRILEALLFAAHEALPIRRLCQALGGISQKRMEAELQRFRELLSERDSPLQLVELAGGVRLVTRPEFAPYLGRLFHKAERERLSPAALETLAIIAYRQPVTRSDVEAIRGVQAGPVLRVLQEHRLIKSVGRAPVVGRPLQYGTTRKFLDIFGLGTLNDLPDIVGRNGQRLFPPPSTALVGGNGHTPTTSNYDENAPAPGDEPPVR